MRKQYHILNGDVLKNQFPNNISGDVIIFRECLVEGNINGNNTDKLFASRAKFISQNYGGSKQDYYDKVVLEFNKILNIDNNSDINLWFGDDLFCQVNFWFVISILVKEYPKCTMNLIRPDLYGQYCFGGLNNFELSSIYEKRIELIEIDKLVLLWELYQNSDLKELLKISEKLKNLYPFIYQAVKAHIDRIPKNGDLGRPTNTLLTIMNELNTNDFRKIFSEFNKKESIYGFGDSQVKRLYDKIINQP